MANVAGYDPGVVVDRVLVQKMAPKGLADALVGYRVSPDVGPMVVLSTGGVLAEIFADSAVRLAPVDAATAREMIDEVKGLSVVTGYRGLPEGDVAALTETIVGLSRLAIDDPDVLEAEVNPLSIGAAGWAWLRSTLSFGGSRWPRARPRPPSPWRCLHGADGLPLPAATCHLPHPQGIGQVAALRRGTGREDVRMGFGRAQRAQRLQRRTTGCVREEEHRQMPRDDPDYIESVSKAFQVIEAFSAEHPALTISEASALTGLTRPTVRRILLTLVRLGFASPAENKTFVLTPQMMRLGYAYLSSTPVWDHAMPYMRDLADSVRESVSLAVLDAPDIVYVARVPAARSMTITLTVGARLPAYPTSLGRVLLASLSPQALDEVSREHRTATIDAHDDLRSGRAA